MFKFAGRSVNLDACIKNLFHLAVTIVVVLNSHCFKTEEILECKYISLAFIEGGSFVSSFK